MDDGATIIELMNEAGYDIATLGNHEFDYGYAQLKENLKEATFSTICCNILDENGKPTRWKIENSWGDASGQKGYYIGSEKWFKANVYQITVRKSLLSDAQRALLDQEPLPMKLWDPLA